jgi:hypothetical protein
MKAQMLADAPVRWTGSRKNNMSYNLLIWRWSDEYADKNRQRRERLTNKRVASEFMQAGQHVALGAFDQESFLRDINVLFPGDDADKPFLVERYPQGVIFNYSGKVRFDIVPVIGGVAKNHGLNSTEA